MAVKAVVLDLDGTLLDQNGSPVAGVPEMITSLKNLGLQIAVASNRPRAAQKLARAGIVPDLVLDRTSVGIAKGSPRWVEKVVDVFQIETNELVWLGDTVNDMTSAVNAKVVYFNAAWSEPGYPYGIQLNQPFLFPLWLQEFFIKPVHWYWQLSETDRKGRTVNSKSMMDSYGAGIEIFQRDLINFLKDGGDPRVGPISVRTFIMHHFIGSIYGDQFYRQADTWTVYPGSKGGTNTALGPLANLIAGLFRDRYIPDLLIRHRFSVDSGEARRQGIQVGFLNQINTVRLNEAHRTRIEGKTVVIIDDFITRGYSTECARNLLFEAGVGDVICVNIGKYSPNPYILSCSPSYSWNAYQPVQHEMTQFERDTRQGQVDRNALTILRDSYMRFFRYGRRTT